MNSPTALPVDTQGLAQSASVLTPWLPPPYGVEQAGPDLADPEKHQRFQQLALEAINLVCPWLPSIVIASEGQFIAMQGGLYVAIPASSLDWIEIPEVSSLLNLLPWHEDGQTPQ